MPPSTVGSREMTELLGSQGSEERVTGLSERFHHEADGIEWLRRSRWGLNGSQTWERWAGEAYVLNT